MTEKEMVQRIVQLIDEKKGEQIQVIDISGVSTIADYFIIAGGSNVRQTQAISDEIESQLAKAGHEPKQIEGYRSGNWILLDYGDIVIHIFNSEDRRFYNLERIWTDGKVIDDVSKL